jgi:phospholipid/cholesterol/gamma-HCH transport system substrate-binding protein
MKGLRQTSAKFIIFAVVSLMAFVLIYNTMQDNVKGGKLVSYTAIFTDVSGLHTGDNVRVAGVQVGKVKTIEVQNRQAKITFDLLESQPILDTTHLVMRFQNLLGQRYISLKQDAKRGSRLAPGATIPVNRTDPGFDLTELLNGFRPLFDILKPADVNQLATTIVQVLQGEGGTVENLLTQTTRLTNFLADRDQILDQVLTNLTPVLKNLNGQGDAINTTVSELKSLMTGLAQQRATIGQSIEQMSTLITQTSDFLVDATQPAVQLVRSMRQTTQMFADNLAAVRGAIQGFPLIVGALGRATSYQNGLNVYVCRLNVTALGVTVPMPPNDGPYSKVCGG